MIYVPFKYHSMDYQVGDRVRIKTWDEMVSEFGLEYEKIRCDYRFNQNMEHSLSQLMSDRIITISRVYRGSLLYKMEEIIPNFPDDYTLDLNWKWSDHMIDCLESDYYKRFTPIKNRFEILDI